MRLKVGDLVFNKIYGRGIIEKKSPSGSLIEVRYKHFGNVTTLSSDLMFLERRK